ncbi:SGNH/GDSL hydrolase family protein [Ancylobacter sonchi]|uniref:SGNH/GDSL hydrolase family protein n=1 Tax=Ancylobacter sonchi TaxID=1937790 RepID=UPI001BD3EF9E|nr:SGNH/GDSL hydrolase family protein [Ancylobacter sonchi]
MSGSGSLLFGLFGGFAFRGSREALRYDNPAVAPGILPSNAAEFPLRRGEYYGQVGTNCWVPSGLSTRQRISYFGAQRHSVACDVTEIAVRFANWFVNRIGNKMEYAVHAQTAYSIAIEYPAGTVHPLSFGGHSQGIADAGGEICSDFLPVRIPAGAQFWVRVATYSLAPYALTTNPQNPLTGSGSMDSAGRVADRTRSNSSADPRSRSNGMWPVGILARTRHGGVLGIGDSIMQGVGDEHDDSDGYGLIGRAAGNHAWLNAGVSGDSLAKFLGSCHKRLSLARYVKNIVFQHGVNGMADTDLATLQAEMLATWMQGARFKRPGARLFQTTITPSTRSSDDFRTLEGQQAAPGFSTGGNGTRESLNDWLRDGAPIRDGRPVAGGSRRASRMGDGSHPLHAVFDVADALESSRNSGKWKVNGTANWLTADGLHPNRAGYLQVRDARAIDVGTFA